MSNHEMWNAPDIVPSITYADVPCAIEWLERVFGSREPSDARLGWPDGGLAWIEVGWGGRIYRVLDYEGHRWEISQRGRDLAADRWQLPRDVTRGVSK